GVNKNTGRKATPCLLCAKQTPHTDCLFFCFGFCIAFYILQFFFGNAWMCLRCIIIFPPVIHPYKAYTTRYHKCRLPSPGNGNEAYQWCCHRRTSRRPCIEQSNGQCALFQRKPLSSGFDTAGKITAFGRTQ